MHIKDVELYLVEIPLDAPFYPSWMPGYPQTHNRFNLVKIITNQKDIFGVSTSPAFSEEIRGVKNLILPFLIGRDPLNINEIIRVLSSARFLGFKLGWLEVALWDIVGKYANLPVYKLFGGSKDKILAYASTGEIRDAKKRAEDVKKLKEKGFRAVKIRFHREDVDKDIEVIKEIRDKLGIDMDIMVDANQAWKVYGFGKFREWDLKLAIKVAEELEELDVLWLEEPLDMYDYKGLSELRKNAKIKIAGGEMNYGLPEFLEFIENKCYDIVQPDAVLSGGILTSLKVAYLCEANYLEVCPHTWTNGVGIAANLQIAGAANNCNFFEYPIEEPSWIPEKRDGILKEIFEIDAEGYIKIPKSPGLGIELNEEVLKKFGKKM